MTRILVITNNRELGVGIASDLRRIDQSSSVANRETALDVSFEFSPELLIVDASQDEIPARICRLLRAETELADLPLILLLAESQLPDISPRMGIDELVLVPLRPAEIAARVRLVLWRTNKTTEEDILRVRDMVINLASYEVTVRGYPVVLTYKEYELLKFLAMNPGRVYTRETLLDRVWGFDFYGGTRTVDVHIRRIRSKIGDQHESLIQTVRNVGYRFSTGPREAAASEEPAISSPEPAGRTGPGAVPDAGRG
jgi:DNA-binding response OmpR family regulator